MLFIHFILKKLSLIFHGNNILIFKKNKKSSYYSMVDEYSIYNS